MSITYNKKKKKMDKQSFINTKVLKEKLQEYATKVGRISARPLLLLYFIMVSKDTPKSDKLMILSRHLLTSNLKVLAIGLLSSAIGLLLWL